MSDTVTPLPGTFWMLAPTLTCESPIEESFLNALVSQSEERELTALVLEGAGFGRAYPVTDVSRGEYLLQIRQQAQVGRYRFDFLLEIISRRLRSSGSLVVECDGHEFHERTKDQAMRDRSRDRHIQECGAHIFRFTGREIHQDADRCASDCIDFLLGMFPAEDL